MTASTSGTLYIVATPIGNRDDITARALDTLKSVDVILAEDTRHAKPFLTLYNITTRVTSLHDFNETKKTTSILKALKQGMSYALISDAGTPLISDPGFTLVQQARKQAVPVVPIPGPCAFVTALSAAGISCEQFTFLGFLPAKAPARRQKLEQLTGLTQTLIFYESKHRILSTLDDLGDIFGRACQLTLAKELTKTHENIVTDSIQGISAWLIEDLARQKGEFVLILSPRQQSNHEIDDESKRVLSILLAELPLKQAVTLAANITKHHKNMLYALALDMKKNA